MITIIVPDYLLIDRMFLIKGNETEAALDIQVQISYLSFQRLFTVVLIKAKVSL
jgi:hypothetical protein